MRLAGGILLASSIAVMWPTLDSLLLPRAAAQAQPGAAARQTSAKQAPAAKKAAAAAKNAVKKAAPKAASVSYAGVPLAERVALQLDLAWTGYFDGLINGDFTERSVAAVRAFQKDARAKESGQLAPAERSLLAALSRKKQEQAGWSLVDDDATGAQVGLPTKYVPNVSKSRSGTRWSSAQGQIQIETFRIREPGTTLAGVIEQQKREPPNRKIEVNLLRDDFFILSGTQGLKRFYVRAEIRDLEVRGVSIMYDQATDGLMDRVAVVMSSAFAPFPGTGLATLLGKAPRRKIDYGTGIVVSAEGHIVTDRRLTQGCNIVEVAGRGDAERIADDEASGLALLRLYGAPDLVPAALVHEGASGPNLTLIGIADPQLQGGGRAVTAIAARVNGDAIEPAPQPGFAGAIALDGQGRAFGMVALKAAALASAEPLAAAQASIVTVERIRRFLDAQYVTPATGRAGIDPAKAAVVRIICVRR